MITPENMLMPVRRAPNQFAGSNLELAVFVCSRGTDIHGQIVELSAHEQHRAPATANQPARGQRGEGRSGR